MRKIAVAVAVLALLAVSLLTICGDTGKDPSDAGAAPFDGRLSMTSVIVPESTSSIGAGAFEGCPKLEFVTLHVGIESVSAGAFSGCPSLTALTFAGSGDVVLEGDSLILDPVKGLAVINSLDGRLSLPSAMIGGNGISKAAPGTVLVFDGSVWKEAYRLTFAGGSLSKVAWSGDYRGRLVIPPTVVSVSDDYNGQIFDFDKSWVTSVVLPDGVSSIGAGAFYGCDRIQSVELPRTLSSIGKNAFYGCSSLASIEFPLGLKSIGWNAFYGCSSLKHVSVPDGVSDISGAFSGCTSLKTADLPRGLEEIGDSAFYGCSSLASVDISDSVRSIATSAFYRCSSLESVSIPGSVSAVGSKAFEGCSGMKSLALSEGLETIGYRAFAGCSSLESVSIPRSVGAVGADAFSGCSSLAAIKFGKNPFLTVGESAFPAHAVLSESFYYENGSKMISNYSVFGDFVYRTGTDQGYHKVAA
ncbi:MAG: leucine-rich repeat protein [Candidatus Methanomethylophilaceae archaeon]|nr:leucine-rich repeat protein [Candidatus Methanomethylophilaceae archaeon]